MEQNNGNFDERFNDITGRIEIGDAAERAGDTPELLEKRVLNRIANSDPVTLEQEITETRQDYVRALDEFNYVETQLLLRHATDQLPPESEEATRQAEEMMLNDREQRDQAQRVVDKLKLGAFEARRVREKRRELGKSARRMAFAAPTTLLSTIGTLAASAQEGIEFSAPSGWLAAVGIMGLATAAGRAFQKKHGLMFEASAAKKKAAKMMNVQ